MSEDKELSPTLGQKYVGLTFNPSGDDNITRIKQKYADLIDEANEVRITAGPGEKTRLASILITDLQKVQMIHTKMQTWQD